MQTYSPWLPWVYKVRVDRNIDGELFVYINDLRITSPTEGELWQGAMEVATCLNALGLQHAAQKLQELLQTPGAWAGTLIHTREGVELLISQERWEKTKLILSNIQEQTEENGTLDFKSLESWRGYLIYVSRMYPSMALYLKGIHQTLDSWRPNWGADGWKLKQQDIDLLQRGCDDPTSVMANLYN